LIYIFLFLFIFFIVFSFSIINRKLTLILAGLDNAEREKYRRIRVIILLLILILIQRLNEIFNTLLTRKRILVIIRRINNINRIKIEIIEIEKPILQIVRTASREIITILIINKRPLKALEIGLLKEGQKRNLQTTGVIEG